MRLLSSSATAFIKRAYPVFFFGLPTILLIAFSSAGGWLPQALLFVPVIALLVLVVCWLSIWDVVDEVVDEGDRLLIRKGQVKDCVLLANVIFIEVTRNKNPTRLKLHLAVPGRLGQKIVFIPQGTQWIPFARHPLAKELETRIDSLKKEPRPK
ncbi:hypothetical protein [Pseudomonas sp. CGJS7]|uniref:hypothetical protein n=1 Tax=Pseudomonas sp. CGJS7 TaxID=3109348 RepID=UPI00300AE800